MASARFHEDCLVLDGHIDVPTKLWENPKSLTERLAGRHADLPRLREGGVDAVVFALYIPAALDPERGWKHAQELHRVSVEHVEAAEGMEIVASAKDVRRAWHRGVVAVLFGLENGRPLSVPGTLDACASMGVRYVTLTHMATHEWCDASTDQPRHGGLSSEGEGIVWGMTRRGIVPDVSHVSDDAVLHVLEVARIPIVASHSSSRALCDHPRNLPDNLVREIARKDGVVMANAYPAFICQKASEADRQRGKEVREELKGMEEAYLAEPGRHWQPMARLFADRPLPEVPLSTYVDHIVHLIDVAGEEHVGIGTDFDGIPDVPAGFEDASRFPSLTAALLERGVDKAGVRLILGENFLRVLKKAEEAAEA
jgi:membrane dipeptidase